MDKISFSAIQQLQLIHDFPRASLFPDMSDSPQWAFLQELLDAGYIIECQGYSKVGEELIENGAGYDVTPAGNAFLLEFYKELSKKEIASIYLDKPERKLLKSMLKGSDKEVTSQQLESLVLSGVASFKYIERDNQYGGCVAVCNITETGKRCIQYQKEAFRRAWIPIIISIISLVISAISTLNACISLHISVASLGI